MKKLLAGLAASAMSTVAFAHEGDHSGESLGGLVHHSLFDADHLLMLLGAVLVIGSGVAMFVRSQKARANSENADK
ncbi:MULTISPECIES: hypothetical protein [Thalassolituus]|jgi:hydrogenase/urease accessory protein HupE|uniref:hypothetical protein n=1 Tax=Thalassolituus TaxID=187492 RepID=UPI0007D00CF0|nr:MULTISPECIES: hypothetical protein [Thalassolituus]KZY99163.1 hypothetical protein A3746_19260 [Oleibacter sp. HI0075]KZZ06834.1 hypothetical protein A3746_16450 [Oleibacter sp. HI0075]MEE3161515.1 hypothetical protein [Pseudomonadota bacterium]|tara:strand:+ start:140 stop:367 length:228 start_codon:yes stop_codon:yes gene_type:complete